MSLAVSPYFSAAEAKLNNFIRLESSFHLLNIQFDTNMVSAVMLHRMTFDLTLCIPSSNARSLSTNRLRI